MSVCRHMRCSSITPVISIIPVRVTSALENTSEESHTVTVIPVTLPADVSTPLAAVVFGSSPLAAVVSVIRRP